MCVLAGRGTGMPKSRSSSGGSLKKKWRDFEDYDEDDGDQMVLDDDDDVKVCDSHILLCVDMCVVVELCLLRVCISLCWVWH